MTKKTFTKEEVLDFFSKFIKQANLALKDYEDSVKAQVDDVENCRAELNSILDWIEIDLKNAEAKNKD